MAWLKSVVNERKRERETGTRASPIMCEFSPNVNETEHMIKDAD